MATVNIPAGRLDRYTMEALDVAAFYNAHDRFFGGDVAIHIITDGKGAYHIEVA